MSPKIESIRDAIPGLGITLTIALISYLASSMHPSFDALVISVVFGMLVANMLDDRSIVQGGIDLSLRVFLPLGIALYGLQLNISHVGAGMLPGAFGVFVAMFVVCYFISRGIGLERPLCLLLSTGMAVCGASAIIVLASIIGARREDTSISVLSVITVGLTGMIFYRTFPDVLGMDAAKFAFFSGATLPMLGQVKVAASAMGREAVEMALNFKLVRIASLAIVAGLALVLYHKKDRSFHLSWFMAAFFAFAIGVNVSGYFAALGELMKPVTSVLLAIALAAVGLSINFDSVTEKGWGPLIAVFLSWGIVVMAVYLTLSVVV